MKRALLVTAVLVGLVMTFYAGTIVGVEFAAHERQRQAEAYVTLALRLSDPHQSFAAARTRYLIPPALLRRDEAIRYYLLKAIDVDDGRGTGANYFLGLHFLSRDCGLAQFYLERQRALRGPAPDLMKLIDRIHKEGCAPVAATVYANRTPYVD